MTHHGGMSVPVRLLLPALAVALLAGCTTASAEMADSSSAPTVLTTPSPRPSSPAATPAATSAEPAMPTLSASPASPVTVSSASASAPLLLTGEPLPTLGADVIEHAPVGSFVLGDSISLSVAPTLSRLGYPVTGRVGQAANSDFLRQHLASSTAQAAPAWVIVLGTNNRGDEADIARLDEWLATIKGMRNGRPRQHVYWVTPHRSDEYNGGLRDHDLDPFNAALQAAADERRWLHVLDYSTPADENPEWFAQDGARLHPGEDGQAALAALIAGPDAPLADQPRAITELTWPTPEPTPEPTTEEPAEGRPVDQDLEFSNE